MIIKLNKLIIENFKGIKSFEVELGGENLVIKAENGVGKTTVYDAFLWLLFGKNSEGKKEFEVRPLDSNNQPIKGLVVAVEAEIDCDGTVHTFRKEHHEKVVKKQLRGYEAICTIDEVPKKVNEYSEYITELIPEDTFKLLTDLNHFNGKLHWSDRRGVLLDIAGEIGTPEGFDALLAALNGRNINEYKQVLSCRKVAYTKERDEINPRIDEIQKGLNEYAGTDTKDIEKQRKSINAEIVKLDGKRQKLFKTEKERQAKTDLINELAKKMIQREGELKNDTGGIRSLLDEKVTLEADVVEKQSVIRQTKNNRTTEQANLSTQENCLESLMVSLNAIREECKKTLETTEPDKCFACGKALLAEEIEELKTKKEEQVKEISGRGNAIKGEIDTCKKSIAQQQKLIKTLDKTVEDLEAALLKIEQAKEKRFAEIDEQIESNKTVPPESDQAWQVFNKRIIELQKELGEPVSEQLQQTDNQRTEKSETLAGLNKALSSADTMEKAKVRIAELEEKEKELAQKIADVDAELHDVDEYKATVSSLLEQAVNGKFKHVKFELFNHLLNGVIDDKRCEATLNGVPYPDMSAGQKIFVGIDIVNVLSVHYEVAVPMFIDHAESLTMPIETDTQVIRLFAKNGIETLVIEKE